MPQKPGETKNHGAHKTYNASRPPIHKFYQSRQWKKLRAWFIRSNPLCGLCGDVAQIVDHILPIEQGGGTMDVSNLQSLCKSCHNKKHFGGGEGKKLKTYGSDSGAGLRKHAPEKFRISDEGESKK
jgi:5-methylcytosine-specific restriction endonuclease McrA